MIPVKSKYITQDEIDIIASNFDLETEVLKAFMEVHGAPSGFSQETNDVIMHFEPFHFHRYTGLYVPNGVENQTAERSAYNKSFGINPKVATLSTAWGRMKVWGFLFRIADFQTVNEMIEAFKVDEATQVTSCLKTIKNTNQIMFEALQKKDFPTFCSLFFGNYFKRIGYHEKMQEVYKKQKAFK